MGLFIKREVFLMFFLLSVVLFTGCSSVLTRTDNKYTTVQPGVYSSTRNDFKIMTSVTKRDYDSELKGVESAVFTFAALDTPLAFVLDTILLPFDLLQNRRDGEIAASIIQKYLPKYYLAKNPNSHKEAEAYFFLVSPKGEQINLGDRFMTDSGHYANPKLDSFLREQSIKIEEADQAAEVVALIDLLVYGRLLGKNWTYQVVKQTDSWVVSKISRKSEKNTLGMRCELQLDANSVLRNVIWR